MRKFGNKPKFIIVHHFGGTDLNPLADTSNQLFETINAYHKQKWNYPASNGLYCGYHYVIEKSGKVVSGTPENEEGVHTIGHNMDSISVALAGNFDLTLPTPEQTEALRTLLIKLITRHGTLEIVPHRYFTS